MRRESGCAGVYRSNSLDTLMQEERAHFREVSIRKTTYARDLKLRRAGPLPAKATAHLVPGFTRLGKQRISPGGRVGGL